MEDGVPFEDVDFLLKRDWAIDMEFVDDLLWRMTEYEFSMILKKYSEYPLRVRDLLDKYLPPRKFKTKSKVVENEFYNNKTENV